MNLSILIKSRCYYNVNMSDREKETEGNIYFPLSIIGKSDTRIEFQKYRLNCQYCKIDNLVTDQTFKPLLFMT